MASSWGCLWLSARFTGSIPDGWLFAVALGMQEGRAAAVWRAILPIGIGHVCGGRGRRPRMIVGVVLPDQRAALGRRGDSHRARHPSPRSSPASALRQHAHRARRPDDLVVPDRERARRRADGAADLARMSAAAAGSTAHTCTRSRARDAHVRPRRDRRPQRQLSDRHRHAIAAIVFHKLGVGLLRKAWINLDLIWAAALIATGTLTILLPPA